MTYPLPDPKAKRAAKSAIKAICTTKFYPLDYLPADALSIHKLLHWEGKYLASVLVSSQLADYILREGVYFKPIYQGCTMQEACAAKQLKLSFRAPTDSSVCVPYVLIRILPSPEAIAKNATFSRYPIIKGDQ